MTIESWVVVLFMKVEIFPEPLVPLEPDHVYVVDASDELKVTSTGVPHTLTESGVAVICGTGSTVSIMVSLLVTFRVPTFSVTVRIYIYTPAVAGVTVGFAMFGLLSHVAGDH